VKAGTRAQSLRLGGGGGGGLGAALLGDKHLLEARRLAGELAQVVQLGAVFCCVVVLVLVLVDVLMMMEEVV
jgi:uncharacterized membrane protein YebE (DUF533 family)